MTSTQKGRRLFKATEISTDISHRNLSKCYFYLKKSLRIETYETLRLSTADELEKQQDSKPSSHLGNSSF